VSEPSVSALDASTSRGYRRAWIREQLRDSFWIGPAVLLAAGAGLAALTVYARGLGLPGLPHGGPAVDPTETSGVLGIIASSTLTFLGVVFTLTLVALQLASSQLSPRVLRMFTRSGVTKLAFGILLATFSYSVVFLVLASGRHHEPDSRGLAVAMALVTASLIVFVGYVASTVRLLQVSWVISRVADSTRVAFQQHFVHPGTLRQARPPRLTAERATIRLPTERRPSSGVLLGVNQHRLVRLASENDCVLRLLVRPGQHVPAGAPVLAAYGSPPPTGAALAGLNLGRARTMYQDPAFGLRQLVDIAIQALSPAVNQPTTAVQAIDRLEDILLSICQAAEPPGFFAGRDGQVRYIEPSLTWAECVELAFTEIIAYGASAPQVSRRLLAVFDTLEDAASPGRRPSLGALRARLLQELADLGVPGDSVRPDRLGLGLAGAAHAGCQGPGRPVRGRGRGCNGADLGLGRAGPARAAGDRADLLRHPDRTARPRPGRHRQHQAVQ
jgi:uncharacterized membrane protein